MRRLLPAEYGERTQYLARKAYDNTIRFALFYPGVLREQPMKQAVVELIRRIDILHSSFQTVVYRAVWRVHWDFDPMEAFSAVTVTGDLTEEVNNAMQRVVPFDGKLQLHCTLITNGEQSAVVLNVGHMCADGSDSRYLLEKLMVLYNCFCENGDPASVHLKNGTRNLEQACRHLTIRDRLKLYKRPVGGAKTEYVFPTEVPGTPRIVSEEIPAELIATARKKAKAHGASVNDLLLTAFYHATVKQLNLPVATPMGIQSAMDLRRYIPDGDSKGVCNLSGSMNTSLNEGIKDTFLDTLQEIAAQTAAIKEDKLAGLYDFPMMAQIFRWLPFDTVSSLGGKVYGSATLAMTNMGVLNPNKFAAEGLLPTKVLFGAHRKEKPALQIAVIGMHGSISMCTATVCTDEDETAIRELYQLIREELREFAEVA